MHDSTHIIILHNKVENNAPEDVQDIGNQALWIETLLKEQGYHAERLPFDFATLADFANSFRTKESIILNLVDATEGNEELAYLVPGLLKHLGLRFTGCSMESLFLSTDKLVAKRLMHARGIDTPQWIEESPDVAQSTFTPGRYLVKPVRDDASIGIDEHSLILTDGLSSVLKEIRDRTARTGKRHYAERFIDGREFTVCIYGPCEQPVTMAPYEWVFEGFEERALPRMFTFAAKWDESCYAFDHIVGRYYFDQEDEPLLMRVREIALACWHLFGLSGYSRVDFRVDSTGKPWVLEANGNPSFYGFYHSAQSSGTTFISVLKAIIDAADNSSHVNPE